MKKITFILAALLFLSTSSAAQGQNSKGYDAISYTATVQLNKKANSITGMVAMRGVAATPLTTILQHAKHLTLDSLFVDGRRASVEFIDTPSGAYNVKGFPAISAGTSFTLTTYYHGSGTLEDGSGAWGGITNTYTPAIGDSSSMMYALGVGFTAQYVGCTRHWLPCYDLPDDKADSVTLTFLTPELDMTASNGLLVANVVTNGVRRVTWNVSHPIATYLLTFAAAPLVESSIPNKLNIPFQVYSYAKDSAKVAGVMRYKIADALAFYDSLFAPYPFEKVGYVITSKGSMEHQTMISLVPEAIDSAKSNTVAAHELAHMWWGDRVTCNTFGDAWLNEGFATFCESLILQRFYSQKDYLDKQHQNISGALGTALPLAGGPALTTPHNNYPTNLIYQKGAAVLGFLRYYLGDSAFFSAVRYYGNKHAYANATSNDLWSDFETSTHQDLGWFFTKYVMQGGYPTVTAAYSVSGKSATITLNQTQNAKYGLFRLPIILEAKDASGTVERQMIWMDSTTTNTIPVTFSITPNTIQLDPEKMILWRVSGALYGVKEEENSVQQSLTLSPNPNRIGYLSIGIPEAGMSMSTSLRIVDEKGVVVFESLHPRALNEIDTSRFANGIYTVLLIHSDAAIASARLVVTH